MKYWFKPKRFWNWFAAYYPVSWEGWIVSLAGIYVFVYYFFEIDKQSGSVSDTLLGFTPYGVAIFIIFDIITRYTGEYPAWWKNRWGRRWGRKNKEIL